MGFGELEADNGESPGWQKAAALVDGQPHRSNKPRSVQQWLSNKVFQLDLVTGAGVMESTERMVFCTFSFWFGLFFSLRYLCFLLTHFHGN